MDNRAAADVMTRPTSIWDASAKGRPDTTLAVAGSPRGAAIAQLVRRSVWGRRRLRQAAERLRAGRRQRAGDRRAGRAAGRLRGRPAEDHTGGVDAVAGVAMALAALDLRGDG